MKKIMIPIVLVVTLLNADLVYSQTKLNSYPSAAATIYLDFDGEEVATPMWNDGNTLTCAAAPLSDEQISEIFNLVAEDFRPFDINITTDESVFLAAPLIKRIRVIVTPTSNWYSGVGGIAFVGSFAWGDDTPCFVFSDKLGNEPKTIAECCSHESGHSLGLYHQSSYDESCQLSSALNLGSGTGEVSWAPIMGNSYSKNMTGWNNGPTPIDCSFVQDNLSTITTNNGFTYRTDDFPNNPDVSLPLSDYTNSNGVISKTDDKDAFKIKLVSNTAIRLNVKPFSVGANNENANLDVKVQLLNNSKTLLRTYDPISTMDVTIDTVLMAGNYYLVVDGTGNSNTSDYGSLGSYMMRGTQDVLLPIREVVLSGKTDQSKHELNWNIIADEPIKSITIEVSDDGTVFKNNNLIPASANQFIYNPLSQKDIYYRLKVISIYGQLSYSNIIVLKPGNQTAGSFVISTLVQNEISIKAPANYNYRLLDINGSVLAKGNGVKGYNKMLINKQQKGLYILQLLSNNQIHTERIIKQ